MSLHPTPTRPLALALAALGLAALMSSPAHAADDPCDGLSERPCGLPIPDVAVQRVPAVFQLQARVGQAKLPLGDATFQTLLVRLIGPAAGGGEAVLCAETLDGVEVSGGLVNITIGQDMDCELDEVLAENDSLAFQLCLGGPSGCLQPVELASTPYAMKVNYAHLARQAYHAHVAGRASYAHRATADREHFQREELGAGYFDFYTHAASDALALYDEVTYDAQHKGDGYLQWTPVRGPAFRSLHLAGRQVDGALEVLDAVVLVATVTTAHGDLEVESSDDGGGGLVVVAGGADVDGDSDVTGALDADGLLTASDTLTVTGTADVDGAVDVAGGLVVLAGGLDVAAEATFHADLLVTGGVTAAVGLTALGGVEVTGLLTVAAATVTAALDVGELATLASLVVDSLDVGGTLATAAVTLAGDLGVAGDLTVTGELEVDGDASMAGSVVFEAGFTAPEAAPDLRYVLAEGEDRDLTFGGALQIGGALTLGAALDLQSNRLLGARLPSLVGAPPACAAPTEGFFYLDGATQKAWVCVGGEYRQLGGYDCGNGFVQPHEQCDDGDQEPGDGCDAACRLEPGPWTCTGTGIQPTVCSYCGDGVVAEVLGETCDDGGVEPGDGCDASCQVEAYPWDCWGEPSTCYQHASVTVAWVWGQMCPQDYDYLVEVPAGVPSVTVEVWGAQGGICSNGADMGGLGGYVKGDIDLTAADGATTLWARIGTKGGCPGYGSGPFGTADGHGGGYSMVGFAVGEHFLVAGAGGGCGGGTPWFSYATWGGGGGYPTGGAGATYCVDGQPVPEGGGGGGGQDAGGAYGAFGDQCSYIYSFNEATYLQGGGTGYIYDCTNGYAPGGGGGGYYGGGAGAVSTGGCSGSGGGGSSWYDPAVVTDFEYANGARAGHGEVVLTW